MQGQGLLGPSAASKTFSFSRFQGWFLESLLVAQVHVVGDKEEESFDAGLHTTFVNKEIRCVVGRGFLGITSFRHAPYVDKETRYFLLEEREVLCSCFGSTKINVGLSSRLFFNEGSISAVKASLL